MNEIVKARLSCEGKKLSFVIRPFNQDGEGQDWVFGPTEYWIPDDEFLVLNGRPDTEVNYASEWRTGQVLVDLIMNDPFLLAIKNNEDVHLQDVIFNIAFHQQKMEKQQIDDMIAELYEDELPF